MLGRHVKGTVNVTFADGLAVSIQTNRTWRSVQDNNCRRYQLSTDIGP
jgi:prepilin-type processing-associated H-X9-DG protein